jgi:hypothetical protein
MKKYAAKVFFDFWETMDDPRKVPFFSVIENDEQKIIIRNLLAKDSDVFIWISDDEADFSVIDALAQNEKICLIYASETMNQDRVINLPPEYKMTLTETAIVYESSARVKSSDMDGSRVRKAVREDIDYLLAADDSDNRHDYVQQIADLYGDDSVSLYVLECMFWSAMTFPRLF